MISKTFRIPIYFGELVILQDTDFKKIIKRYNLDESASGMEAFAFRLNPKGSPTKYVVALRKGVTPGVVAHEALHVVNMLFDDCCIQLDIKNDEHSCYMLGWIVDKIHKTIK